MAFNEQKKQQQDGDLQEKLVHKNRGDHRLSTVLNHFDRFGVTAGRLDDLQQDILRAFI